LEDELLKDITVLRNRSEVLPSISRYNSENLKMSRIDPEVCIFSPSRYEVVEDLENDGDRLLVTNESEDFDIPSLRKNLELFLNGSSLFASLDIKE